MIKYNMSISMDPLIYIMRYTNIMIKYNMSISMDCIIIINLLSLLLLSDYTV